MRLKEITFILENCDTITIDGKYIGDFLVDDIHTNISRIACNAIEEVNTANIIAVEIHKDANKEHYQFDIVDNEDMKCMVFDRFLNCPDITSIIFELFNDYTKELKSKEYEYTVNWTGDSDDKNEAQKTYLSNCENLYIVIAENKEISDFFDLEDIDNPDHMDFYFDMLDVGDEYGNPDRYNIKEE